MKRNVHLTAVALVALVAVALTVAGVAIAAEPGHGPAPSTDPRFEFLKSLAGTWVSEPGGEGMPPGKTEFRVTAGGHAVEEREFAGTPMEMVTLYYMEGADLVATHYCMLGNQPKLKAADRVVDGRLDFACAGTPGGAASHDEEHVHGWSIARRADGTVQYDARLVKAGDVTMAPSFLLTRKEM